MFYFWRGKCSRKPLVSDADDGWWLGRGSRPPEGLRLTAAAPVLIPVTTAIETALGILGQIHGLGLGVAHHRHDLRLPTTSAADPEVLKLRGCALSEAPTLCSATFLPSTWPIPPWHKEIYISDASRLMTVKPSFPGVVVTLSYFTRCRAT